MDRNEHIIVHHPGIDATAEVTRAAFVSSMVANGWIEIEPAPRLADLVEDVQAARGATVEYRDGRWVAMLPIPEPVEELVEPEPGPEPVDPHDLSRSDLNDLAAVYDLDPSDYARKEDLADAIAAADTSEED